MRGKSGVRLLVSFVLVLTLMSFASAGIFDFLTGNTVVEESENCVLLDHESEAEVYLCKIGQWIGETAKISELTEDDTIIMSGEGKFSDRLSYDQNIVFEYEEKNVDLRFTAGEIEEENGELTILVAVETVEVVEESENCVLLDHESEAEVYLCKIGQWIGETAKISELTEDDTIIMSGEGKFSDRLSYDQNIVFEYEEKNVDLRFTAGEIEEENGELTILVAVETVEVVEESNNECEFISGTKYTMNMKCDVSESIKKIKVLEIGADYVKVLDASGIELKIMLDERKSVYLEYVSNVNFRKVDLILTSVELIDDWNVASITLDTREKIEEEVVEEVVVEEIFTTRVLGEIDIDNLNGVCEEFISEEIINEGDNVSFIINEKNINVEYLGLKSIYNDHYEEYQNIESYLINGKETYPWEHYSQFSNIIRTIVYGDDYYSENREQANRMYVAPKNIGSINDPKVVVYYNEFETSDCGAERDNENNDNENNDNDNSDDNSNSEQISCDNGCIVDDKCLPYGYRKSGDFCSTNNVMISQQADKTLCENNFQCGSNLCIDSACVEAGLWKKIMNWFSRIF